MPGDYDAKVANTKGRKYAYRVIFDHCFHVFQVI